MKQRVMSSGSTHLEEPCGERRIPRNSKGIDSENFLGTGLVLDIHSFRFIILAPDSFLFIIFFIVIFFLYYSSS